MLPEAKGLGLRQTVVRIRSRQSIQKPVTSRSSNVGGAKIQGNGSDGTSPEKQQDCTEYVVLQRFMLSGEDGDWKIWGLAEETTPDQVVKDPAFAPGLSIRDRISLLTGR
jgi:protein MBA1